MGQVWQATDTQLNRQVALKILPDAFASDPDRLARFTREAQILASLNHPNLAAIHGIEEAEGTRALVLELVEGPTLADRIAKGAIPLDEALPIAKQIADIGDHAKLYLAAIPDLFSRFVVGGAVSAVNDRHLTAAPAKPGGLPCLR